MLRGIFLYVAFTSPSRRRGGRHASTQSIKNEAAVLSTRAECRLAWVVARRGSAFWTGLPIQEGKKRDSSLTNNGVVISGESSRLHFCLQLHTYSPLLNLMTEDASLFRR